MKDLTVGNPVKLIFKFSIPILIGNVFQLFYSIADTAIIGKLLGEDALAAVGATAPINSLIIGFIIGLANGFSILTARNFGSKDYKELKKCFAGSLILVLITAFILSLFSIIFMNNILYVLNTPENIIAPASDYIKIILFGITITALYNICASVLRSIGDTIVPLFFLIFSTILNIVLDYAFIKYLNLGISGAAYATVISQCFSVVACFIYIKIKYSILHLKIDDFKISCNLIKNIYFSGLSMGFMMSFVFFGTLALQSSINTFGDDIIVAHMAARKVTEFFMLPFSVCGTAMATYCSQNMGAGKINRIKKGLKSVIIITWVWSLFVILMSYTISPLFIKIITDSSSEIIISTAVLYLKIDTVFYFVPALISILRNSMQGMGDHKTPIFSSFLELIGKVIIALFLAPILKYMGIILAEPIVWIIMVIPLIVRINKIPAFKEAN